MFGKVKQISILGGKRMLRCNMPTHCWNFEKYHEEFDPWSEIMEIYMPCHAMRLDEGSIFRGIDWRFVSYFDRSVFGDSYGDLSLERWHGNSISWGGSDLVCNNTCTPTIWYGYCMHAHQLIYDSHHLACPKVIGLCFQLISSKMKNLPSLHRRL